MDFLPALLLWLVGFGISMLALYYVVRAAVRDGIGLADADRAKRAKWITRKREMDAEEAAARERAAERQQALRGGEAVSGAASDS